MGKLHELLAVEKSKSNAANKLLADTLNKFGKSEYFKASSRTLKMLADSSENEALEASAYENSTLPTTVKEKSLIGILKKAGEKIFENESVKFDKVFF